MCRGDLKRLFQCSLAGPESEPQGEVAERLRQDLIQQMSQFPGYRIAEKKTVSPDEVTLGVQSSVGGQIMPMTFKRIGNEWKGNP
jgi:hypothetical protein